MSGAIDFAIAIVASALIAGVAYSVPKIYWYSAQVRLLNRAQDDSTRLISTHIADNTENVPEVTIRTAGTNGDGQYL